MVVCLWKVEDGPLTLHLCVFARFIVGQLWEVLVCWLPSAEDQQQPCPWHRGLVPEAGLSPWMLHWLSVLDTPHLHHLSLVSDIATWLLVGSCKWVSFEDRCVLYFAVCPRREARDVWCLPLSGISGLSFVSTSISSVLFFCLVLLLFLSYLFFCQLVHSPELFQKILPIVFIKR